MRLSLGASRIAVACCATILLAACSSSSPTSSGSAPTTSTAAAKMTTATSTAKTTAATSTAANFDSCSVVTQSEAASALSAAVTPGVLGSATVEGGLACVFYGASATHPRDPNVAQADSVRVVVVKGPNALTWYNDYKSKVKPQPISSFGDHAYYDGYASLSVLKGDAYLRIAISPAAAPPSLPDEKQLASAILPKL